MNECTTILQTAVEGTRITPAQATLLFDKADLVDLADAADKIRQRRHPDKRCNLSIALSDASRAADTLLDGWITSVGDLARSGNLYL